ncbi:HNH endonuclease [Capnocytophaga canimorsus]|uniref:HNH endonuclease n=1 Tax=Capnocytophaga canimorsus TaxID=28188 RepID=UPI00385A9749
MDIYGKVRTETKESANFVPFRYQGMQMQLVKQKIHSKVSHIGGVKEYKEAHNGEGYESVNKKKKITCKT